MTASFFIPLVYPIARAVLRSAYYLRCLRISARRSLALKPPQTPNSSLRSSAYCKHTARTAHAPQIRFGAFADFPSEGKNSSGSVCAHNASTCQAKGPSTSLGVNSSWSANDASPLYPSLAVSPLLITLHLFLLLSRHHTPPGTPSQA